MRPSPTSLRMLKRELAMAISFPSLGSSHTRPLPHFSTDAAKRFCNLRFWSTDEAGEKCNTYHPGAKPLRVPMSDKIKPANDVNWVAANRKQCTSAGDGLRRHGLLGPPRSREYSHTNAKRTYFVHLALLLIRQLPLVE
ncbi:hypothetical protein BBBOND_0207320 [Babesia bigemina]|uniref:Uncharacterized protein n=1 Tax=Babesia bigemina TaxID=5866 RepID=A0A061D4B0_BABBI|nr:hypothetical protein BBBOND_0207320 [Babesia bigemina]CDR95576.1 hypothetical protein BBBOND_0207320 [Babesia bigemina]|eukprot:XP_012767762.1 hypothetical protein BBBOND_0207320 [Babesia bigemina]